MTHTQTTCPNRITFHTGKKGAHPVEVGALTSMFKKSATELKLKQKLVKCKCTMQTATFNVRTLNRIGQLPELTVSAIDHNIDIICIKKHRYIHREDIKCHDTGNGSTLVSTFAWKNSVNTRIRMVATFNGNPSTTIISCYSPTNVSEETDPIVFYNELSSLVCSILKHNVLVSGERYECQNR